jgi:hypothetical protein
VTGRYSHRDAESKTRGNTRLPMTNERMKGANQDARRWISTQYHRWLTESKISNLLNSEQANQIMNFKLQIETQLCCTVIHASLRQPNIHDLRKFVTHHKMTIQVDSIYGIHVSYVLSTIKSLSSDVEGCKNGDQCKKSLSDDTKSMRQSHIKV